MTRATIYSRYSPVPIVPSNSRPLGLHHDSTPGHRSDYRRQHRSHFPCSTRLKRPLSYAPCHRQRVIRRHPAIGQFSCHNSGRTHPDQQRLRINRSLDSPEHRNSRVRVRGHSHCPREPCAWRPYGGECSCQGTDRRRGRRDPRRPGSPVADAARRQGTAS